MHEFLVIQSAPRPHFEAGVIAALTDAVSVTPLGPHAFRLDGAHRHDGLAAHCEREHLDWAWVPHDRQLAGFRLAVMDMDSTLITIECIDEIADLQGLKPQVAAITAAAMRGELDYPASLRERVALLKGLPETALARVYDERLKLSPGAQAMLARFRELGIRTLLVSGGFAYFTERLKARLELDETCSNVLEIEGGRLTGRVIGDIVDADAKAAALRRARDRLGIERRHIIALGDGANDLKFMAEAGVSVAFRAKPVVRAHATHALNYTGLDGVLRLFAGRGRPQA